jgi:Protein of unknown function DUF72
VGTASWTDRTLLESGCYPPEARTPASRLQFYASRFPLVEVDATYYALPAEQTAASWAARTPTGFTFNVKAFSLFTQHPTRIAALPADLRPAAQQAGKDPVYLRQVDPAVAGQAWDRFLAALEPLRRAGKLGVILLQFPRWFLISRASKDYILACAGRPGSSVHRVPQPHLDDSGQPAGNSEVPLRPRPSVRVRRYAAGLSRLHPAGAGGHGGPGRHPAARPFPEVDEQGHPRAVRVPLERRPAVRMGAADQRARWPR